MAKPTEKEITLRAYQFGKRTTGQLAEMSEFYKQAEKELNERQMAKPAPTLLPADQSP